MMDFFRKKITHPSEPPNKVPLKQFASRVVNFSSQYGTAGTSSYTASNLAGHIKIFDRYGDFQEAFVLRTYGPWWRQCPSVAKKLKKTSDNFRSVDFVELEYVEAVIPSSINIFETYHPGAVVRILACNSNPKEKNNPGEVEWITLWSGPPQCSSIPKASRIFSPPLKKIEFSTQLIRLEFNSEECEYYTELDAVEMIGQKPAVSLKKVDRADGFQVDVTARLIRQLSLTDRQTSISSEDEEFEKWGYFGTLSDEIIQYVFSFLDVVSLSNVAQTCSLLFKNAYDPHLYTEVDLQSHWNTVDDVALEGLTSRCSLLKNINLSWTGGGGQITEKALCSFLEDCGSHLVILRLACCSYIGKETMATIAKVCKNLEELDLQSCESLCPADLTISICSLPKLRRLNLYNKKISESFLKALGSNCPHLEHLNLGACVNGLHEHTGKLDTSLIDCLSKLKNLKSLDLWRCRFVTTEVINCLGSNCPNLEELDIGWCHSIYRSRDVTASLCSSCTKLKKLFLTCGRTIGDDDLWNIAKHCRDLEQLDILGSNSISPEGVTLLCKSCPKLAFFDVSFCSQIREGCIDELKRSYPNVCFKKSFS